MLGSRLRGIGFDQLRTFAEVIERASFTAAADHLGLSQPAVSQQIRLLEQRFGVRLIELRANIICGESNPRDRPRHLEANR